MDLTIASVGDAMFELNVDNRRWSMTVRWWTRTMVRFIMLLMIVANGQSADISTVRTKAENTATTVVDVAGSNREWFAIALCRTTCLDISDLFKLNQQEQKTPPPVPLPNCVLVTRDTCGPVINLNSTLQDQKITCSSADGSPCSDVISEQVTDYDKCVQLCQNPEIQKSCLSPCISHRFILTNANLNETSHPTWVTAVVPLSPRPVCKSKRAPLLRTTEEDSSDEENGDDVEEEDEEVTVEEEDCDLEGGVMIKEVWDTKGANLKWAVAPAHHCPALVDASNASSTIVYIVQMRQLLRLQPNLVADEWKTITATTLTSTSLKYVLTLGLHYQVRIIAMSARGICSATEESRPFGLPKGHPSPGPPRNLRYADYNRASGGVLGNTIHWDPPAFSIPISHYLITWFIQDNSKTHGEHQNSETYHQTRMRHHLHSSRHPPLHPHVLIPGKKRTYCIRNLLNGHIYVVKIQAVARLGDISMYGEPASLKIQTYTFTTKATEIVPRITTNPPVPSTTSDQFSVNILSLNVTRIVFESGILEAVLRWNCSQDNIQEIKHFLIRVHSQLCPIIFQLDHSPKRDHEHHYEAKPTESSFTIRDLRFDCIYQVGVVAISKKGFQGAEIMTTLETPQCHQVKVHGDTGPDCPPSAPHHFLCNMDRVTRTMAATCQWTYRQAHSSQTSLRGFLIVANTHQSPHRNGGQLKNTSTHMLVNKDARQVVLTELVPNTKYYVTIRVVGVNGLGPNAHAHFFASSPPFYHGNSHSVTYQAWRSNGGQTTHSWNVVLNLGLLAAFSKMWQTNCRHF